MSFTIIPSSGQFYFPKPLVVAEETIYSTGGEVLVCTLDYGETWVPGINASMVRQHMASLQAEKWGFNHRRREIIKMANVTAPHTLLIILGVDFSYDVSVLEEIIFSPASMFTTSKRVVFPNYASYPGYFPASLI